MAATDASDRLTLSTQRNRKGDNPEQAKREPVAGRAPRNHEDHWRQSTTRWRFFRLEPGGHEMVTLPAVVKPLKPKHQRFVDEYMVDRNATQAYIRAGYSPKGANTHAARLVANGPVSAEIARRVEEYSRAAGIDKVWVLERMKAHVELTCPTCSMRTGSCSNPRQWPKTCAAWWTRSRSSRSRPAPWSSTRRAPPSSCRCTPRR